VPRSRNNFRIDSIKASSFEIDALRFVEVQSIESERKEIIPRSATFIFLLTNTSDIKQFFMSILGRSVIKNTLSSSNRSVRSNMRPVR
jgi:hypothetical protein